MRVIWTINIDKNLEEVSKVICATVTSRNRRYEAGSSF